MNQDISIVSFETIYKSLNGYNPRNINLLPESIEIFKKYQYYYHLNIDIELTYKAFYYANYIIENYDNNENIDYVGLYQTQNFRLNKFIKENKKSNQSMSHLIHLIRSNSLNTYVYNNVLTMELCMLVFEHKIKNIPKPSHRIALLCDLPHWDFIMIKRIEEK